MSRHASNRLAGNLMLTAVLALGLGLVWQASCPHGLRAQSPPPPTPFQGTTLVTAHDVVVEVNRQRPLLTGDKLPRELTVDDFSVVYDGRPVTIVSIEPSGAEAEPWSLVIYVDALRLHPEELAWTARLLAAELPEFLRLGSVSIVIADPEPRVLASGQDEELLAGAMARLELFARDSLRPSEGQPNTSALRRDLLEVLRDPQLEDKLHVEGLERQDLVEAAREEERRLGDEALRGLREFLVSQDPPTPRRAALWVGRGLDAHPERFYAALDGKTDASIDPNPVPFLRPHLQALAAHGWAIISVLPPEPDMRAGLRPGWRLGKWRIRGLGATYEEDRDPERADAFFDLGQSHESQQQAADAIDAYEKALFHYAGDPRTSEAQARTYRRLEALYAEAGLPDDAQEAAEYAKVLEAEAAARAESSGATTAPEDSGHDAWAERFDPLPTAELAAELTVGWVVGSAADLRRAIASLDRRVRLTFQVETTDPDTLAAPSRDGWAPLEVETSRALVLRTPSVARPVEPPVEPTANHP